jgi:hypothetical protein
MQALALTVESDAPDADDSNRFGSPRADNNPVPPKRSTCRRDNPLHKRELRSPMPIVTM